MEIGIGAKVKHHTFGLGVVSGISLQAYKIFFKNHGEKAIARSHENLELLEAGQEPGGMALNLDDVKTALTSVLHRFSDFTPTVPLGSKWKGGKMILQPKDAELKAKEIPIETFFHKIVMLRDRLRVLEQHVNSNENITDEEKVNLQQYVTRCYGTLTTFNVLFESKEHQFKGGS